MREKTRDHSDHYLSLGEYSLYLRDNVICIMSLIRPRLANSEGATRKEDLKRKVFLLFYAS